jgi:hypothetical protein
MTKARQWYDEQARKAGHDSPAEPTTEQLNAAHRATNTLRGGSHFEIYEPARRRTNPLRSKACTRCRKFTSAGGGCPGAAVGPQPLCHSDEAAYLAMIDAATASALRPRWGEQAVA